MMVFRPLAMWRYAVLLSLGLFAGSAVAAEEWTRFRGPNGEGASEAAGIPTTWTEADYNWKVELPGTGNSCPVAWGEKLFIVSGDSESGDQLVECRHAADGRVLWERRLKSASHNLHAKNTYATSTPAVDAERVYVAWASPEKGTLLAMDHAGKDVWQVDLGPFYSKHGYGTSPVLVDDMLILSNDIDDPGISYLLAVDRKTGKEIWRTERKSTIAAYSTPCLFTRADGTRELIFNSNAHGISGIDPATGKVNWEISVFDKRSCSSPFVAGGLVFGSCGSGGGGNYVVAVRPGDKAGKPAEIAYKVEKSAPYVPTSVAYGDLVFLWSDQGVVSCIDAASGEVQYQARVGGNFSGSPICIQDRIYCLAEDGACVVLAADRKFKVLARNALGEAARSTPAVAGGRLYLRTQSSLISLGAAAAPAGGK